MLNVINRFSEFLHSKGDVFSPIVKVSLLGDARHSNGLYYDNIVLFRYGMDDYVLNAYFVDFVFFFSVVWGNRSQGWMVGSAPNRF